MRVHIIRANGIEEFVEANYGEIEELIGAKALDTFRLRDGRVVYVDDLGHQSKRPVNKKATELYHGICRPGTTHVIVGDVAVIRSEA